MTVIDDMPPTERLAAAAALFHIATGGGRVETLRGLIQAATGGDVAARWLGAAALAFVADEQVRALAPLAEATANEASDPLLRETARWATERSVSPRAGLVDCRARSGDGRRPLRLGRFTLPTPWLAKASSSSTWAPPTRPGHPRCAATCGSSCPTRGSSTCTR